MCIILREKKKGRKYLFKSLNKQHLITMLYKPTSAIPRMEPPNTRISGQGCVTNY